MLKKWAGVPPLTDPSLAAKKFRKKKFKILNVLFYEAKNKNEKFIINFFLK
jgi:hypothetical protein